MFHKDVLVLHMAYFPRIFNSLILSTLLTAYYVYLSNRNAVHFISFEVLNT